MRRTLALIAVAAACSPRQTSELFVFTQEEFSSGGRTPIDVLWVIDDSNSMYEEQAALGGGVRTFMEGVAELAVDMRIAVITTDTVDSAKTGRFQAEPARHFGSCREAANDSGLLCTSDSDCGDAGCLCGVPHLRRCEQDDECDAAEAERCISSGSGSTVKFCSPPCETLGDCRTALSDVATDAFWCSNPPETPDDRHCLLRVCSPGGIECTGADGFQCLPSEIEGDGAEGYCRLFENRDIQCQPGSTTCPLGLTCRENRTCPSYADCPAPTCDCPKDLDPVLTFGGGGVGEPELEAAARTFRCLANVGTDGDDIEKGLGAVRWALSSATIERDHPEFPRDNAHLVIVIVSDEDDCTGDEVFSSGADLPCEHQGIGECVWCKDALDSVTALADFVRSRKRQPWRVAVAAIVGDATGEPVPFGAGPAPACASDRGVAFSGDRYASFVREFGSLGITESICGESFEGPLDRLAGLVVSLRDEHCLGQSMEGCDSDGDCPSDSTCSYWWGASGQCAAEGEYTGQACASDGDCSHGGACDDRRICLDSGGDPTALKVLITRAGSGAASLMDRSAWALVPNANHGCLEFQPRSAPGPEDAVRVVYRWSPG